MLKKGSIVLMCIVFAGIVGIFAGNISFKQIPEAHAALALFHDSTNKNLPAGNVFNGGYRTGQFATTSMWFMDPSKSYATTTFQLYTAQYDHVGLNFLFTASSTATNFKYRYEYSADGINWYSQVAKTNTSATTTQLSQTPAEYSFQFIGNTGNASSTATQYFMHDDITALATDFLRVVIYLQPGSANGAVNVQATIKANNAI